MKLSNETSKILSRLYSYSVERSELLKHRKNNAKWFYIITAGLVLTLSLGWGNFDQNLNEELLYIIAAVWFMSLLFMKQYFPWGFKELKYANEEINRLGDELKKNNLVAFYDLETDDITISKINDDKFYSFRKILNTEESLEELKKDLTLEKIRKKRGN